MKSKVLDSLITIFILAVGLIFFYLVRNNEILKNQIVQQEAKANALISEIGQTKEENNMLFQQVKNFQANVEELKQSVKPRVPRPPQTLSQPAIENAQRYGAVVQASSLTPQSYAIQQTSATSGQQAQQFLTPPQSQTAAPAPPPPPPPTTNFLIVGQNSALADTIILAMADEAAQKISFVNIPRDLHVNGRKINEYLALYDIGALKQKVEAVSGLKVDHYAVFNFRSFENVIDALGGVDINVPRAIYDSEYPNGRGGYTVYSVQAGMQHMNGAEALKYARSRHSTSDFSRSMRQQQIIDAVKDGILNLGLLNNFAVMEKMLMEVSQSVQTDFSLIDALNYMLKFQSYAFRGGNVISTANLLYSSHNIRGQYILLPRTGASDFSAIQNYIRQLLL